MKKSSFFIAVICIPFFGLCQKKGYRDIELGDNLHTIVNSNHYKIFTSKADSNTFFVLGDTLQVCNIPIDHISIHVNKMIIDTIELYTKAIMFSSYNEFSENWKNVVFGIVNTVGKASYNNISDYGTNKIWDWSFEDTQTLLALRYDDTSINNTNFQRGYLLIWIKDKIKENKMW